MLSKGVLSMETKTNEKYGFTIYLSNEIPNEEYQELWLIEKLIAKNQTTILYGDEDTFKTPIATDLAFQIQNDCSPLGTTQQTRVLFLCLENRHGMSKRMVAFHRHYENGTPIATSFTTFSITNEEDVVNLIKFCKFYQIGLVIFDTLSQALYHEDESNPKVARAIRNAFNTMNVNDITCLVVHHTGKNHSAGARGSAILTMDFSGRLHAKRRGIENEGRIVVEKSKSDYHGKTIPFHVSYEYGAPIIHWNKKGETELTTDILSLVDESEKPFVELLDELYPSYDSIKKDSFRKKLDREIEKLVGQEILTVSNKKKQKFVSRTKEEK